MEHYCPTMSIRQLYKRLSAFTGSEFAARSVCDPTTVRTTATITATTPPNSHGLIVVRRGNWFNQRWFANHAAGAVSRTATTSIKRKSFDKSTAICQELAPRTLRIATALTCISMTCIAIPNTPSKAKSTPKALIRAMICKTSE